FERRVWRAEGSRRRWRPSTGEEFLKRRCKAIRGTPCTGRSVRRKWRPEESRWLRARTRAMCRFLREHRREGWWRQASWWAQSGRLIGPEFPLERARRDAGRTFCLQSLRSLRFRTIAISSKQWRVVYNRAAKIKEGCRRGILFSSSAFQQLLDRSACK